jgi:hypothetical protein
MAVVCGSVRGETPASDIRPELGRPVHAIELPSTNGGDTASWIIEPEVPRIPKIAGLPPNLPRHIERRLSYAFDLAQRGATFTANAEFRAVISMCALELDAKTGGSSHRDAFREGWAAFDEADDFTADRLDWRASADVRAAAAGHVTQLVKSSEVAVDSVRATETYYAFAEERLTYACKELPGASLAFYGLARTFVNPEGAVMHATAKAAVLHRVALGISPQNVLAGNELGVLLAEHGQLAEAEQIFRQCVAIDARPETWRNLSVIYARQGNVAASRAALAASESLAESGRKAAEARAAQVAAAAKPAEDDKNKSRKPGFLAKFELPKLRNPFRR